MDINLFPIRLKELREENGYRSQQALADTLGVAQSTVGNWEAGKREPNFEMMRKLAALFHVSVDYLVGNVNEPFFYLDNSRIIQEINDLGDGETKSAPAPEDEREIGFDDFTYAMQNETKELTDEDKEILLSMARQLRAARGKNENR